MTLFSTIKLVASKNVLTTLIHASCSGVNKVRLAGVCFVWIPHLPQNTWQCYKTPVHIIATACIHLPLLTTLDEFLTIYFKTVYNFKSFNMHAVKPPSLTCELIFSVKNFLSRLLGLQHLFFLPSFRLKCVPHSTESEENELCVETEWGSWGWNPPLNHEQTMGLLFQPLCSTLLWSQKSDSIIKVRKQFLFKAQFLIDLPP